MRLTAKGDRATTAVRSSPDQEDDRTQQGRSKCCVIDLIDEWQCNKWTSVIVSLIDWLCRRRTLWIVVLHIKVLITLYNVAHNVWIQKNARQRVAGWVWERLPSICKIIIAFYRNTSSLLCCLLLFYRRHWCWKRWTQVGRWGWGVRVTHGWERQW